MLVIILSSLELFLYFRAVSVVRRAALEASHALASATPGGDNYSANSLPEVKQKYLLSTPSGGTGKDDVFTAFTSHGELYEPSSGNLSNSIKLPFSLSTTNNPDTIVKTPEDTWELRTGVQYLPFVTVPTCLEPHNESSHNGANCNWIGSKKESSRRFLTYQLPTVIDFDGDGGEDLAFFYANPSGDDWWIIPSSSGTFFRSSLRYDQISRDDMSPHQPWIPCPADYDGDKKTDLCVSTIDNSGILLRMRFSSRHYLQESDFRLSGISAQSILPVAGRWDAQANRDQFAAVLLETELPALHLATLIWPPLVENASEHLSTTYGVVNIPKVLLDHTNKPNSGRNWRPAFGDHDGDGVLDIGWLTWAGGHDTFTLPLKTSSSSPKPSASSKAGTAIGGVSPWALFYPNDLDDSAGLYIVERDKHRISLFTSGSDKVVNSFWGEESDKEHLVTIAGSSSKNMELELPSPNPLSKGLNDKSPVPVTTKDQGCRTCYPGGAFAGDGGSATRAKLNSPTAVFTRGKGPLYVADYGNYRLRKIEPGLDEIVNGGFDEPISTIVGGRVPAGVRCPSVPAGAVSKAWDEFDTSERGSGIHPNCVSVRALSLAMDTENNNLIIGDESGWILKVSPGRDGEFNSSTDERMTAIAGLPSLPAAMEYREGKSEDTAGLFVLTRPNIADYAQLNTDKSISSLLLISKGGDSIFGSSDDRIYTLVDASADKKENIKVFSAPAESLADTLKNPSGFALVRRARSHSSRSWRESDSRDIDLFISSWWNDERTSVFQNTILHYFDYNFVPARSSGGKGLRHLNNWHLNSWGKRAPENEPNLFNNIKYPVPLGILPAEPAAGIAISPDNQYLYFSQTRLGQILILRLDQDSDGVQDFAGGSGGDSDIDGDGIENEFDRFPLFPSTSAEEHIRTQDVLHDAVMWAKSAQGKIDAAGKQVDRLEWLLDRFAEVGKVPYSPEQALPPGETAPFLLLNEHTVAAPNAKGILHDSPVWPDGILAESELGVSPAKYRLAALVLSSKAPNEFEIKDVSGYEQCLDWTLKTDSSKTSLTPSGVPISDCSRNIYEPTYEDGRTVGTRRAHLSHWQEQWQPFSDPRNANDELRFIDWDGDGGRNPAVFVVDDVSKKSFSPLMVHIGNMRNDGASRKGENSCPGSFAISELSRLNPIILDYLSRYSDISGTHLLPQYHCAADRPFFTSLPTTYVSIMSDLHAEWKTSAKHSVATFQEIRGNRFRAPISPPSNHDAISFGPVAETAYRVLESSLRVKRRAFRDRPHDAMIQIIDKGEHSFEVEVSYVFPLNPILARVYGAKNAVIRQTARRRAYNFGKND